MDWYVILYQASGLFLICASLWCVLWIKDKVMALVGIIRNFAVLLQEIVVKVRQELKAHEEMSQKIKEEVLEDVKIKEERKMHREQLQKLKEKALCDIKLIKYRASIMNKK